MHMTREIASLGFLSPPYRYIYSYLMDYTVTTLWTMHFKTIKHQLARIINYTSMPEIMLPHNWPRGNGNKTKLDAELL